MNLHEPALSRYKSSPPVLNSADSKSNETLSSAGDNTVKFGGVRHEGRSRSFGGDWHARRASRNGSAKKKSPRSYSKKSNRALTIALEQTSLMTTADKEHLIKVLFQNSQFASMSHDSNIANSGVGAQSTTHSSNHTRKHHHKHSHKNRVHHRHGHGSRSPKHKLTQNNELPKLPDNLHKVPIVGGGEAWTSPTPSPSSRAKLSSAATREQSDGANDKEHHFQISNSMQSIHDEQDPSTERTDEHIMDLIVTEASSPRLSFFARARQSLHEFVAMREQDPSTATFTADDVQEFMALINEGSKYLSPKNLSRCISTMTLCYSSPRSLAHSSFKTTSSKVTSFDSDSQGKGHVKSILSESVKMNKVTGPNKRSSTGVGKAKSRFLAAIHAVKRGLYTNRIFMHSHRNSMTTRDALLAAGATEKGLDLPAMLRILDSLGFPLSAEESKAAEKYVGFQKNKRIGLKEFEMFLSDISTTETVVRRSKLRGSGSKIFLGGSCNPTTWRRDIAIPLLMAHKVPFFNPQVEDWDPSLVAAEARAKQEAPVLLFVIDASTRAIASMIEVVELISEGYTCVVVIHEVAEGQEIGGEVVSKCQTKDLNRARAYLADVISRHSLPVFSTIGTAVQHSITIWMEIMDSRKNAKAKISNGPNKT